MQYKAFISYSHQADQKLASALQTALQQFAKPYYSIRALSVFRDQTELSANPSLWRRIEAALDSSEFFLLLASPEAAKSYWVKREIDHWLRAHQGRPFNFLLLLTGGNIRWDVVSQEFDWAATSALPEVLDWDHVNASPIRISEIFKDQPFHVDLRWARAKAELSLRDPEFLDNIGTIAAELHGQPKSALVGRDVVEHKRFRQARLAAIIGLALFAIAATVFGVFAYVDRNRARSAQRLAEQRLQETKIAQEAERVAAEHEREQRQIAESRALANASYALSDRDPTLALHFAQAAFLKSSNGATVPDATTAFALLKAFNSGSWFYSERFDSATDADLSKDGTHLAWIERSRILHLLNLITMTETKRAISGSNVRFVGKGTLAVWHGWSGRGTMGELTILDRTGTIVARHKSQFLEPILCPSGEVMVPSFGEGRSLVTYVLDGTKNTIQSFNLPPEIQGLGFTGSCLLNGRGVVVAQTIPGVLAIADLDGRQDVLRTPQNYLARDLDLHLATGRIAVYLRGAVRGTTDALGWLETSKNDHPDLTLKIVPLPLSPASDSGGIVRFLPDGRVIAASTAGWTRLVNLNSGESAVLVDATRATDQIGVLSKENLIVLARRSGTVGIYSLPDVLVGRLLGETHSDGLNVMFTHLSSDDSGDKLLTVSRNGVRLWRRPRYDLTILHSERYGLFDPPPKSSLRFFDKLRSKASSENVSVCPSTSTIRVDDWGQMSLCAVFEGRVDYFATGIPKDDLDVIGAGPTGTSLHRIVGEKADRLFVLSPSLVLDFIKQESGGNRLWTPDLATQQVWTGATSAATPRTMD